MIDDIHQQWLQDCRFRKIHLKHYILDNTNDYSIVPDYSFGPDLFDTKPLLTRTVKVSELDTQMGSIDNWKHFIEYLRRERIGKLILLVEHSNYSSPIVLAFRRCTLQAYICHLQKSKIKCSIGYIK